MDILFLLAAVTSGMAAFLFWLQYATDDEADAVANLPSETATLTLTSTATFKPTRTATLTATPSPTATRPPTSTATLTLTPTPWPTPVVDPLDQPYAGQPLTIAGMAQPGDAILVYDQGLLISSVTAGDDGEWSAGLPDGLGEGFHALSVVAMNAEGASSESAPVGFEVKNPPTPTATSTHTPSATATRTPLPTATATFTPTATRTLSPTATETPEPTATLTVIAQVPTATATRTPSPTATATRTPSPTATATFTATATRTPSPTATATATFTATATDAPTPTATPSPVPPTKTPIPPTETPTSTPSETPEPTTTTTGTPTPLPTRAPTDTPVPIAPPQIASLPPTVSILEPVVIGGSAEAGQTIALTANGALVGEVAVSSEGMWELTWIGTAVGIVEFSAVAANGAGQTSVPALAQTELVAPRPRIDAPASGEVYAPGTVPARGMAQPGVTIEIRDTNSGAVLATTQTSSVGTWQVGLELRREGLVALVAAAPDEQISEPVTITIAPPAQPVSGAELTGDPDETGRAFTALLALLLTAGGFCVYFAGRLLTMAAKDH